MGAMWSTIFILKSSDWDSLDLESSANASHLDGVDSDISTNKANRIP